MGYQGLAGSEAVANDAVSTAFPEIGGRLISVLVCVSALGAVNGLIFTGARISYAIGADHRAFRPLGKWDQKTGTPLRALILQGILAIVLIIALASFGDTIIYTAGPVYLFYLATNFAVFVLRRKEPNTERPYRVSLYPVTTLIFFSSANFISRLSPLAQFSIPSSSSIPPRFPDMQMTLVRPASAALGISSSKLATS